jgi:hypothetical protein
VQTTYQQPTGVQVQQPGCPSCQAAQSQTTSAPPASTSPPQYQSPQEQNAPQQVMQQPQQPQQTTTDSTNTQPSLGPPEGQGQGQTQPETFRKPVEGTDQNAQPATPGPGEETNGSGTTTEAENATYFEAPKLFNPKDRTASRSIAPVRTALYEQPATMRPASAGRVVITKEQAERDAEGWTSLSN